MLQSNDNLEIVDETVCNVIEGIVKDPVPEEIGLTQFGNEAAVCASNPYAKGYFTQDSGADILNITKYFERPVILTSGSLNANTGRLYAYGLPDTAAYAAMFGADHWSRLRGCHGVRGTLVFTLNVTSSAFNQGILALCYQYGISDPSSNLARSRYFNLCTYLPHVKLDVSETTMVQLEVPFVSPVDFIHVDSSQYNFVGGGHVAIVNLTGSDVVAGQSQPDYTLYVSMKDIELIGVRPFNVNTVTLQSGIRTAMVKAVHSAGVKSSGSSAVTEEAAHEGLVSGTLSRVGRVARSLSQFPALSEIGGVTSWFAEAAANGVRALGFSKPMDEKMITRIQRYAYGLDGQVDVPSSGMVLSPFQGNKVSIDPSVGIVDEDEMIFDYVLGKYQFIFRGNLSTTNAISEVIYGCPICPTSFWFRDQDAGGGSIRSNKPLKSSNALSENTFFPSTLCYLADNFRWWRGSFKFRITFAKTKLHGGRVQASFVPYLTNPGINTPGTTFTVVPDNTPIGPVTSGYTYVFDLRDSSSFEFEVPYISSEPYTSVTRAIGDLSLMVVSPLKANPSVASSIRFMVEVCALPGFEFAAPAPSLMSPVPPTGSVAITYQSGVSMIEQSADASQCVIGEVFKSVKQVMMQPDYFSTDVGNASLFAMHFEPWFKANAPSLATPMSVTAQALWFASRSSRMANLYAFARGATMAILQKEVADNRVTFTFNHGGNLGDAGNVTFSSFYDKNNNPYSSVFIPETLESTRVKLPIYGNLARFPVVVNDANFGGQSVSPNFNVWNSRNTNVVPVLRIRNNSGATTRVVIGRAAADDAVCARFIGPPPCIVLNSLATVSPVFGSSFNTFY